jgi:hypothetical protein
MSNFIDFSWAVLEYDISNEGCEGFRVEAKQKNSAARKEARTLLFNSFIERLSFLQQFRVKIGGSF